MRSTDNRRRSAGFTLIELMIALAIVAILAMIAYPAYQQFVRDARQSDVQRFMLDVSSRAQQYRMDVRNYPDGFAADGGDLDMDVPSDVDDYYTVKLEATGPPPGYTITATPKTGTMQEGEPKLELTNTGKKSSEPPGAWE